MSGHLLNAWITRSLEEYMRIHGEQPGRLLPANGVKSHKVQIIRCITEETEENPNQTIWVDVSDGLHEIPVKFSREGREQFRNQMRNRMQSVVRFRDEEIRGAIFVLEDIRPTLTKVPLGGGRVGLSHEEQLVLEVKKLSLIKPPEIIGEDVQIIQPDQGLKRAERSGTRVHDWGVALRSGNGIDLKGDNRPPKMSRSNISSDNAAPNTTQFSPEPEPAPFQNEMQSPEATVEKLSTHHSLLYSNVYYPLRWESPIDVDEQMDFVESEDDAISEDEEEANNSDVLTEIEDNVPSSPYSWGSSPGPSKQEPTVTALSRSSAATVSVEQIKGKEEQEDFDEVFSQDDTQHEVDIPLAQLHQNEPYEPTDEDVFGTDSSSESEKHSLPDISSPLSYVGELINSDNEKDENTGENDQEERPMDDIDTFMEEDMEDDLLALSAALFKQEKDTSSLSNVSLPPSSRSSMVRDLADPSDEEEIFHTAKNSQVSQNTARANESSKQKQTHHPVPPPRQNSSGQQLSPNGILEPKPTQFTQIQHSLFSEETIADQPNSSGNSWIRELPTSLSSLNRLLEDRQSQHQSQHQERLMSMGSTKQDLSDSSDESTDNEVGQKRTKTSQETGGISSKIEPSDKGMADDLDSVDSSDEESVFDILTERDTTWGLQKSLAGSSARPRPRTIADSASITDRIQPQSQSRQQPAVQLVYMDKWRARNRKSTGTRAT